MQEFFAAEAIDRYHWDAWWTSGRLLSHVGDPWWDEVFVHLAGGGHAETLIAALVNDQDDLFHTRLLLAGRCLAGANAAVDRTLQERVIDGLFCLLTIPLEAGSRSAAILADLGTAAVVNRLLEIAQEGADDTAAFRAVDALLRLRHPKTGALALKLWEKSRFLTRQTMEGIARFAGPAEVSRLVTLGTEQGRLALCVHLLSQIGSPTARAHLMRLMAGPAELPAVRLAAALALLPKVPDAATTFIRQLWAQPQAFPALALSSIPDGLAIELIAGADVKQVNLTLGNWIGHYCQSKGLRVTDRRLQRVVGDARALLHGRYSGRQMAAAQLLAALGDETVRTTARRWLAQKRRAQVALELLVEHWPYDLLGDVVPADVVQKFIADHPSRVRDLARKALPVVENWWHRDLVPHDSPAYFDILTALVAAGVAAAVPDFCAQVRRAGAPVWYPTAPVVEALLAHPSGRRLVLDLLSSRVAVPTVETADLLEALPDTDDEVLYAGLQCCLSLMRDKTGYWQVLSALQKIARGLDLFIYRDTSGELRYRPR